MWRTSSLLVFGLTLGACGHAKPAPAGGSTGSAAALPEADDDATCPLAVPGTSISVEDTAQGPSLVFVTTGDVAAVRTRAAAFATMHNHGGGDAKGFGAVFQVKSVATAADIDGGARVTFAPADPSGGGAVGDELRMHAQMLGAGSCAMHM